MLTPEQLAHCANDILELYSKLEEAIVRDIARRVAKTGTMTDTAIWQAQHMQELGTLNSDILNSISKYSGKCESELKKLFEDAAITATEYDNEIYRANGLNPKSIKVSDTQLQILEAGYKKTHGNLSNLTLTTAVSSQTSFINACSLAELKATSGAFSPQQAIVDAIKQVAVNGAEVIYPSGHTDKLDVAVRRNVMTGIGQTTGQICLANARELGCDLMEITAHAGARPSHSYWQGQVVSLSGRKGYLSLSDIGYGSGDGFKGWNCRHDWYPYFGGTRMYDEEKLKQMDAKNIEYPDGSMHTLYEAEQKQRAYERKIRESKRILAAYDESIKGAEDNAVRKAYQNIFDKESVKLKRRESELDNFCDKTGLLKRSDRVQKYGFGRSTAQKSVQANKKAVAKNAKKSIIKNIDIDDFELITYGKNISSEVGKMIVDTMSKCEANGKFVISEIVAKSLPKTPDGTPVLQIEPIGNGLLQLNLNTDVLSNKTLEEIDKLFANSNLSVANSLEEAIVHESGHAKMIFGKTSKEVKILYEKLSEIHIKGISFIAYNDGAEALAELEVLRKRGTQVSEEMKQFYEKYMRRKY